MARALHAVNADAAKGASRRRRLLSSLANSVAIAATPVAGVLPGTARGSNRRCVGSYCAAANPGADAGGRAVRRHHLAAGSAAAAAAAVAASPSLALSVAASTSPRGSTAAL